MRSLEVSQDGSDGESTLVSLSHVALPVMTNTGVGFVKDVCDAARLPQSVAWQATASSWSRQRTSLMRSLEVLGTLPDGVMCASVPSQWMSPGLSWDQCRTGLLVTSYDEDTKIARTFTKLLEKVDLENLLFSTTAQFLKAVHEIVLRNPAGCGLDDDQKIRVKNWVEVFDPKQTVQELVESLPEPTLTALLDTYSTFAGYGGSVIPQPSVRQQRPNTGNDQNSKSNRTSNSDKTKPRPAVLRPPRLSSKFMIERPHPEVRTPTELEPQLNSNPN
ncbi:hypothetical protein GNI_175170 [Gregarina niphandrodes]|uniref:Uncharacterized protein n=1 Tax=Gregarina niphandrodes TaxID=110365 RepID=A0A023AY73_GRENI|nr:hypothetical protein GNI_175170 [Gregarina niphandrodes]EZG43373.1 hypothetical protein GNI_175170 [Gregarina niphandrodes]|eukprot:XP_011134646.1 hypothetical protein GNI_175170 [Gregarina niphandrodes]